MLFISNDPASKIELNEVDSTNKYLLSNSYPSGTSVVALSQTEGKGRRGRIWVGEPGSSFLFSAYLETGQKELESRNILMLPLVVGLATLQSARIALEEYSPAEALRTRMSLKWPNDIILERDGREGKLAGVLVESEIHSSSSFRIAIGVGLNWKGSIELPDRNILPPVPLFPEKGDIPPVFSFRDYLIPRLNVLFKELLHPEIILKYLRDDFYLSGKRIEMKGSVYSVNGPGDDGALVLFDENGEKKVIYDADWDRIL